MRTASPQSQSSLQSGSFLIDALISSSVTLRSLFRSLLIFCVFLGASRNPAVVFFSFISPRSPRRYDPAYVVAESTYKDDFDVVEKTKDHVTYFALPVGPPNDDRPLKHNRRVLEGDVPLAKGLLALVRVPIELANFRQQSLKLCFCHSRGSRGAIKLRIGLGKPGAICIYKHIYYSSSPGS